VDFCTLQRYEKGTEALWGVIPTKLKTVITIASIESVRLTNAKSGEKYSNINNPCHALLP